MKHEKNVSCLVGAAVALLLAFGMAGALITGFGFEQTQMGRLFWICLLASLVSAVCFRFRWGGTVLLCLLVPVSWLVFRREQLIPETCHMVYQMLRRFHNAYGWGVPAFLQAYQKIRPVTYPVGILGAVAAMAVCRAVCRGRGLSLALATAVLPVCLCFVVTDTVPDTPFLFLWMLGLVVLILPQATRRADPAQGMALTGMTTAAAALALGLLFLLVPREGYDKHPEQLQEQIVHWAQELPDMLEDVSEDMSSAISGTVQPDQVNLNSLGPRPDSTAPVMEVTASRDGILYLRGQDFDLYDGNSWTATRHRTESFSAKDMESIGDVTIRTRRIRDVLYLPYYPGSGIALIGGRMENSENLRTYSFYQWVLPEGWQNFVDRIEPGISHLIVVSGAMEIEDHQRYRTLPNDTQQWAKEKLEEILDDESTAFEKADTIARYVKNAAAYDRNTRSEPGENEDFVRWFLEEAETGYCVHFATSAVVLLRAAGIEARYVEGYMTNAVSGTAVTVTEGQAHAWVEYYEPAVRSWVVLEATPADPQREEPQIQPFIPQESQPRQTEDADTPETQGSEAKPELPGVTETGNKTDLTALWKWVRWILVPLLMAALLEGQRKARIALRRYFRTHGAVNQRAMARWREIALVFRLLREEVPEELVALAQKAKYSQHRISPDELAKMDKAILAATQRLKEKNRLRRLLNRYLFAI